MLAFLPVHHAAPASLDVYPQVFSPRAGALIVSAKLRAPGRVGLRETLFVGAVGGFTAILPILFSPIPKLHDFPEPEEPILPTVAAAEGGLAPGVSGGLDGGALSGAGPAVSKDG